MGFRFQKRIGIGAFGRVNISKSGVSLSEGVRGAHITLGRTPRITLGIPGSGLSWTQTFGTRGRRRSATPPTAPSAPRSGWAILGWVIVLLAVYVMISVGGGH